jgi:hypothetical protein
MKRKFLKIGTTLAVAVAMSWNVTAQTLTLDLQAYPKATTPGGYWTGTLNDDSTAIRFGEFEFSHLSQYGGYYWEGTTYATNGDNANYGFSSSDTLHSGSVDWIGHQWGVMAGGGILNPNVTPPTVQKSNPYLVSYWGYFNNETFQYDMNNQSVKAGLVDGSLFSPQEIYICPHPWPYWGNFFGDGFAQPLNQPDDHFDLIIHGVKEDGTETTSITINLAAYSPTQLIHVSQSPNWRAVDLTDLGEVEYIYFTMFSTDDSPYGPNTAVYFCMDKLKVEKNRKSAGKDCRIESADKKNGRSRPACGSGYGLLSCNLLHRRRGYRV